MTRICILLLLAAVWESAVYSLRPDEDSRDDIFIARNGLREPGNNGRPGTWKQRVLSSDGLSILVDMDVMEELPTNSTEIPHCATGRLLGQAGGGSRRGGLRLGNKHCLNGGAGGGGAQGNPGSGRPQRRQKRNAILPSASNRWPNNIVYYQLDLTPALSSNEANVFGNAVTDFSLYTCIQLIESNTETYRVRIRRDGGCWSVVGRKGLSKQPQKMSLSSGCISKKSIVMHEFMHTLGVHHEHKRPDQSDYVSINYTNVQSGKAHNFQARDASNTELYSTAYSYESIMHYSRKAFNIDNNFNTITTLDPTKETIIGKLNYLSYEDIQLLNNMYPCGESSGSDCPSAPSCPPGGYVGPGCLCYCRKPDLSTDLCPLCPEIGVACDCATNGCDFLPGATCSTSGACDCSPSDVVIDNQCIDPSTITCAQFDVHCHCSLSPSDTACDSLDTNAVCNSVTDKCECDSGYALEAGACVNINSVTCTSLGVPCFCSFKSSSECSTNADPNSVCDDTINECVCAGGYTNAAGTCVPEPSYVSNGQFIVPFIIPSSSDKNFVPKSVSNSNDNDGNGWYLIAKTTNGNARAIFETGPITQTGDWCVTIGMRLKSAKMSVGYQIGGGSWTWQGWETAERSSTFLDQTIQVNNPSTIKFQFIAEEFMLDTVTQPSWIVHVDPVKVQLCPP